MSTAYAIAGQAEKSKHISVWGEFPTNFLFPISEKEEIIIPFDSLVEQQRNTITLNIPPIKWELMPLKTSLPEQIFEREKKAFFEIKRSVVNNPDYKNKYIAIVNGEIVGVGDNRIKLAREVYAKKGYVTMYIGEVKEQETIAEEPSFEAL